MALSLFANHWTMLWDRLITAQIYLQMKIFICNRLNSLIYRENTTYGWSYMGRNDSNVNICLSLNYAMGQVVTAMDLLMVSAHADWGQNILPIQPCDAPSRHCRLKFNSGWSYMGWSDGNVIICQSLNYVMGHVDNCANIFTDENIHM